MSTAAAGADADAVLHALASSMLGSLTLPGDDAYDAERSPWNLAIDQRPAAVAHVAGVDDVRAVLAAAREAGLAVAVQPSGHGATGALEGAILVRTAALDGLAIDAGGRTARIGAGVRWGAVLEALDGTGLAAPAGTSRVVSAAGYVLGGGHGWFARSAGLGAHALRAATLVRPDGALERIDDASDPEGMWALRGGVAPGIVTELELDLVEAPTLVRAELVVGTAQAAAALRAVRDAAEAHDAGGAHGVFVTSMRMPDAPQLPEAVRGRTLLSIEALAADEAALAWVDGVRAVATPERDEVGPTTQLAQALAAMEPADPSASRGTSVALARLDDATIDALLAWRDLPEQAGLVGVSLRLLGGALDAPPRPAFGSLAGARWLAMGLAPLFPGAPPEAGAASLAGLEALLAPSAAPRMIQTFLGAEETLDRCGSPDDVARLRAVRDAADPARVLHEGRLPR